MLWRVVRTVASPGTLLFYITLDRDKELSVYLGKINILDAISCLPSDQFSIPNQVMTYHS
jgi:hypothetical protein